MVEKTVYDPDAHKEGEKNLKPKAKPKTRADEPMHAKEAKPEKKEKTPFINKYGFLHVDKNLASHLGIEFGKDKEDVPVAIELIEGGFIVRLKA
jgi:hypothetical protein